MFKIPILFLAFNRPDVTALAFAEIKRQKPKYLYFAADGPRSDKEGEKERCELCRKIVLDNIDWDCEVKTRLQEVNLGCGKAVSSAITWFFDHVEEGIILEDDVLPANSFFSFCEEMLLKYRSDAQVMSISGVNFLSNTFKAEHSYVFSKYGGIWGWASWRRAWKGYDYSIASWGSEVGKNAIKKNLSDNAYAFFEDIFNRSHQVDTWDYQWWFHKLSNNGLDIIPSVNLARNLGFDDNATHTRTAREEIMNMQTGEISFPLQHPSKVGQNKKYDSLLSAKYYSKADYTSPNLFRRILRKLNFAN